MYARVKYREEVNLVLLLLPIELAFVHEWSVISVMTICSNVNGQELFASSKISDTQPLLPQLGFQFDKHEHCRRSQCLRQASNTSSTSTSSTSTSSTSISSCTSSTCTTHPHATTAIVVPTPHAPASLGATACSTSSPPSVSKHVGNDDSANHDNGCTNNDASSSSRSSSQCCWECKWRPTSTEHQLVAIIILVDMGLK